MHHVLTVKPKAAPKALAGYSPERSSAGCVQSMREEVGEAESGPVAALFLSTVGPPGSCELPSPRHSLGRRNGLYRRMVEIGMPPMGRAGKQRGEVRMSPIFTIRAEIAALRCCSFRCRRTTVRIVPQLTRPDHLPALVSTTFAPCGSAGRAV